MSLVNMDVGSLAGNGGKSIAEGKQTIPRVHWRISKLITYQSAVAHTRVASDKQCDISEPRSGKMILTAHQPVYLPWLGLFHKIALAEQFCIFDIVQYQTKDFNNRNKIKTHTGPIWLSVPVESNNHLEKLICDIRIVDNGWNKKHVKSIKHTYIKAPYYKDYMDVLEGLLLGKSHTFLTELNSEMLATFLNLLGIDIPIVKASDFEFSGKKSDLVLDMCVTLRASDYIFGEQGKNYAEIDAFRAKGINVYFQRYNHPSYDQLNGAFTPYMSVVDLLFNCGPASRDIIMSGNALTLAELDGAKAA